MSVNQAFNFRQVSESLATAGLLNEAQLGALAAEGYQAVINLLPDDLDYAVQGEAAIVQSQGLAYTYIPVVFEAPGVGDYEQFEAALSGLADSKVLVHCAANYRVSAFYAIYAYRNEGWSRPQVEEFIAAVWDTAEHPVWEQFIGDMLGRGRAG